MTSHEVLKNVIDKAGAKAVASGMGVSPALVYKWCEPDEAPDDSGARNPLDRVLQICDITHDVSPVEWLCQKTGGFRVDNPKRAHPQKDVMLSSTQAILKEFSDLLGVISESYANDGKIDPEEAKRIRKEWEHLKVVAETFVMSCEKHS